MPNSRQPPAPLPDGAVLIRTGFLFGIPAIFQSTDAINWKLHSTHASAYQRNVRFYHLTQLIKQ